MFVDKLDRNKKRKLWELIAATVNDVSTQMLKNDSIS